ncbi:uncharacterized protein LOC110412953 isoform X2 [Herrania umbratica]|uniref:Uncharacterized protein LOC110412953 isoform X2 n=1 Tax=Herrania umbratica TaxID=108875 RepID=A0A6J0ZX71_9ROSI|nr:uncharacterized protein LOC110412953 isoform X2 [Herrania umbratica]
MESDLLEISGEDDDSLLSQHAQAQTDDVSAFNTSYFSCSPLHFPRSNPLGEKVKNPSFSSNIDKENINNNASKSELPKLSLDPQQMKRKRKGRGYNLRKSLAWDRAFFTEEGVLNSTELSLISGDFGNLSGEKLSVIEEERIESLCGDSPDLQALENNLFKELPLNNSNKNEQKKIGSSLLQKSSGSAPRSAVKQNVLSVHDVNRSGSKRSGCPRPVISSALKRPANVSTTKAAAKEPIISKIPVRKPDSLVLSTTAKSASNINKAKGNQSAQAVNAHRNIGLSGSKRSTRSTQNDAKSSLSSRSQNTKSYAQQAKRNVGSSALASHLSTYLHHPSVTKADNGLKGNQDPVVAAAHGCTNHEAGSSKIASLPQSGCRIGGNTQYAQPRIAKPSGLRMPSPSLGFFSQSKTNSSQNPQSSSQLFNNPKSKIPNLLKLGVFNSICESPTPSMKVPVVNNGVAATKTGSMSSTESSVPSSVNSLCENIRPNLQMPRVEVKVLCNSDNHELMNNQQQLHTIDNDLNQQIQNVGLQCTDNKLLLQSQSSEQVNLDYKRSEDLVIPQSPDQHADESKDPHFISHCSLQIKGALKTDVGNQLSGKKQHNSLIEDFDLFPQLHSSDMNSNNIHGSSKVKDDQISSTPDSHGQPSEQVEQAKPCTFHDDQIINEIERPHINDSAMLKEGEDSEEFLSYNSVQSNGICQKVRDCSASELEMSNGLSHYRDGIQGNDGSGESADFNLKSNVGDAQMHSFKCDLSLENSSSLLNDSEADNQQLLVEDVNEKLVEPPPLPDPGIVVERVFQDKYGSHSTDCLSRGEIFSSEKVLAESNLQSVKDVASEPADAFQSEPGNPGAPCLIPPALQKGGHEMTDVVECLYVEHVVSVSTDTQCNCDINLLCEPTSEGLEGIGEDQVTGSITACDIGVSNDRQSSADLSGSEIDNYQSIAHFSPVVQFKGYSEIDDITDLKSVESKRYDSSAKYNSAISEPEEKITSCHIDASSMLTNSLLDKQNDHEKSMAQAELIQSSFEACKASQQNQIPDAYHRLKSVEGKFAEESHNLDSNKLADVSPEDKGSVGLVVEGPFGLSQVECIDETNELCAAGANETTTRSFEEHAHSQSFDSIPLESCKSNLFTSAEINNYAMVVEDLNDPPDLQNVVIVEQILSDKIGLSVNEEVSSSVKIKVSDDNHDCYNDMIFRPDSEQSGQATSLNFDLSSLSEDQNSGAVNTCNSQAFCSLNEESTSSINANQTSSSGIVLQEEVNRLEKSVPQELNSAMIPMEAEGGPTSNEKTGDDKKQDAPIVKPPLNAVPSSDEWLAAFEAAGEEILTMKSGAVQHSPKDKSLPEPGPWSPVRRKNNQGIGPFDCTKFTNTNIPPGLE